MDLQNIQDQLNSEFSKQETRIIFWFDDNGLLRNKDGHTQNTILEWSKADEKVVGCCRYAE